MGLSEDEDREWLLARCAAFSLRYFRGTRRGASGKFFQAVRDNLRQLDDLLRQFSVIGNIALNTVPIGL